MKKTEYPCPCGGKVKWLRDKVIIDGVDCGILEIERCEKCGEDYLPDESLVIVEQKLKEKGLWGVKRKEVKFWKSGNSVTIRVPTKLTNELGLKKIKQGYIYPEGDHKIGIEF